MDEYFREKRINPKNWNINPQIQRPEDMISNEKQLQAVRKYALKHLADGPKVVVNNMLVDVSEITKGK
jgi:hypothetical protein